MHIIQFFTSFNRPSTVTDRLIDISHQAHRLNLKKSLTARIASATTQGNLTLMEQLKAEARYLDA